MDRYLSLLLAFSLLIVSRAQSDGADPLIRQVVDGGDDHQHDHRLGAEHHFSLFKHQFGKSYASQEEHDYRFEVFKANLRRAARHQRLDPSAQHGVTQFSDMTPAEFRKSQLGLRGLKLPADATKAPILPTENLPEDFDWRDRGAVTAVKNQVFFCFCCKKLFYLFLISLFIYWVIWVFVKLGLVRVVLEFQYYRSFGRCPLSGDWRACEPQ